MDTLIRVGCFAIASLVLLVANLWFARLAIEAFSTKAMPDTIAPIQMVGVTDQDGRMGQALAGMLLARLFKIQQEIEASGAQLRAPSGHGGALRAQEVTEATAIALPARLFEPVRLDMKVAGVELGGLVSWMQRAASQDNVLNLMVENGKGRAVVSGTWAGGRQAVWAEVRGIDAELLPNEKIVSAMAYALAQQQFVNRVPEVGALNVTEFQELLGVLGDAALLQRRVQLGRVAEIEFAELLARIERLVDKTPRWTELLQFGAGVADNGGKLEKAIDLYNRALAFAAKNDALRADLSTRIAKLTARVEATNTLATIANTGSGAVKRSWPLAQIGVTSLRMASQPRIAVVGGMPLPGTLDASHFEVVGGKGAKEPDAFMGEYIRSVVSTVQLVAPEARFIFTASHANSGVMLDSDMLAEIDALAKAKPDMILITLGPFRGLAYKQVFARLAAETFVVLAAGNEGDKPLEFEGDPVLSQIAQVAAIGADGERVRFSQRGKDVLWAPGEKVPVKIAKDRSELRSGTTYSAALVAGVAARVLAEHPHTTPAQLLEVLRRTSRPVAGGKLPVVNLDAALKGV